MIGTGYVGLVTGACLAELGHDVVCVDKDRRKIEALDRGSIPIYEPGLDELVARNVSAGRLRFSLDLAGNVKGRDAVFIAVGTPSNPETGQADLSYVLAAAAEVADAIDQFTVIVTKSTVPTGTNRLVAELTSQRVRAPGDAAVASNPEFLREGAAIADFMKPDRIVIGVEDERARRVMTGVYDPFVREGRRLIVTGLETAELVKYAANAFLAVKVSFINEVADLCEAVGADVDDVAQGLGSDTRIGSAFLEAGPGWGGSCFPKDTRALDAAAREYGIPLRVVRSSIEANAARKGSMAARIEKLCGGSLAGKKLAVFGLTFKGQTDDMRESPSLDVLPMLLERGAQVRAHDPSMPAAAGRLLPQVSLDSDPVNTARDADALIVMTDWKVFLGYDLREIARAMADPMMIDLRNLFDRDEVLRSGFRACVGVGRWNTQAVELDAGPREYRPFPRRRGSSDAICVAVPAVA